MNKLYKNVFVIDDNQADISFLKEAFKDNELIHKISPFTDSASFIEYTEKKRYWQTVPDVILLDINMPDANGALITDKVRKTKKYQNVPIVILSGSDNQSEVDECYQKGANVYFKKPNNYSGWVEMVESIDRLLMDDKGL